MLRLLESIHGHLGVLALAGLLHPAILLRHGRPLTRRQKWAVALSTLAVVAVYSTGLVLYPDYVATVKRPLFRLSPTVGMLFETKEHLAFATLALALGATLLAVAAPADATGQRRVAALLYAFAAAGCLFVAALGTYVASVRSF